MKLHFPKTGLIAGIITLLMLLSANQQPLSGQTTNDSMTSRIDTVMGRAEEQLQRSVEHNARGDWPTYRRFIQDSLQLVYEEKLAEVVDSLRIVCQNRIVREKDQDEQTINRLSRKIESLRDSLSWGLSQVATRTAAEYDSRIENRRFAYLKQLRAEETKKSQGLFKVGSTTENIIPHQLQEYEQYLLAYFPDARCDSVQDFITQTYIRQNDWARAEHSLLRFVFLFPESPLAAEVKNIRAGIFQTERYYQNFRDWLVNVVNLTPSFPDPATRYYKFLETFRDNPDATARAIFIDEAVQFLRLYPEHNRAPRVCLWLAEMLNERGRPHSAYTTYQKLMILHPNSAEYAQALYQKGRLQRARFAEYEAARATYQEFIQRYANDTLAVGILYELAEIADLHLSQWENAIAEYQRFADTYPQEPRAITAMVRRAQIQADKMNNNDEAVLTYDQINSRYPDTEAARDAILAAAALYEKGKRYEDAALKYYSLFENYPNSEKAATALENAATIYETRLKNNDKMIEMLNLIVTSYPASKNAVRASKKLVKLQPKTK